MRAVHIDGSVGEGGGQVLRTSLSLAALLGCELTIEKIRAGRSKPGLAAQHVTCVRAAAAVCGAQVEGDRIGSSELVFRPGALRAGQYVFDVSDVKPSAGSTSLVLQTVLPPLVFAGGPSEVTVRGGTNVPWSPPHEYLELVFLPAVARTGVRARMTRTRGGWYPAGGGQVRMEVEPTAGALCPLKLTEPGDLHSLTAVSTVSAGLPTHIAGRQLDSALKLLPHHVSRQARRRQERPEGGPGTCLLLAAEFTAGHAGASALGERGKPAEKVGQEAAEAFLQFLQSDAAVDLHLGDQLLLYAALADGPSVILAQERTLHLETNAHVIGQFLDVRIELKGDRPVMVRVEGAGHRG